MSTPLPTIALQALQPGDEVRAVRALDGHPLAARVDLALSGLRRLRGLIGRAPLAAGEGLLLRPCAGIHTCFMSYPIDAAFLDAQGNVQAIRADLRPWRLTPVFAGALATLELPAGTLAQAGVEPGDLLAFQRIKG